MRNKILNQLRPFRIALIILSVFLLLVIILGIVVPTVRTVVANSTPVVSISAENDTEYQRGDQINPADFHVTAIHENGGKSELGTDEFKINRKTLRPIGDTTEVTITYNGDESISCKTNVKTEREKIVGFQVGYPEISGVTAVLYSNGELCFEGEGDALVCNEGEYPWSDYEGMEDNPILSISFEEGVTPSNMNYWFEDVETLTYVDSIPASVQSMERTFANCTGLAEAVDWSECTNLYNIDGVYYGCTSLKETVPLIASIRSAYQAYSGCTSLVSCPDSSGAESLSDASEMYYGCSNLAEAEIGPSVETMSMMFLDCINLRRMPAIPEGAIDLSEAFCNCVTLGSAEGDGETENLLTGIPSTAENISSMFADCNLLRGELFIDCNAEEFSNLFSGRTCKSTEVNLTGLSQLLDVYANTNEYGNVFVNGKSPDPNKTNASEILDADAGKS